MRDGARATKFSPDFVRVAVVLRIGVIEVGRPIGDGRELLVQVFSRCHEGVRQSFRNRDREFGAIGQSQSSLVFKFGRYRTVTDDHGIAVVINIKKLGG